MLINDVVDILDDDEPRLLPGDHSLLDAHRKQLWEQEAILTALVDGEKSFKPHNKELGWVELLGDGLEGCIERVVLGDEAHCVM